MKTLFQSLGLGLHFLIHPRESVDQLFASSRPAALAWTFLLFCGVLWGGMTAYLNLSQGISSRGREMILGISLGPDIIISLLTPLLAVLAVALAAALFSGVAGWRLGHQKFGQTFFVLAFTLNAGSIFFDFPHELYAALLPDPWQFWEIPAVRVYAFVIMFGPILWSLIVTVVALAHLYETTWRKALQAFALSVLPVFAALIFIVM